MTNKGFTSKIYDQLIQLNIGKKAQLKNEKDTWIDSFPTGTWKTLSIFYQGNENQNGNELSPDTCQNGYHQKEHTEQMMERMQGKGNPR